MAINECSLAELMEDPLVGLVMQSDGVERCELELLFERIGRECALADRHHDIPVMPAWPGEEPTQCSPC
jgi:hypothetical protein